MPDVIVGAAVGLVVGWCFGPLAPVAGRWLSKTSILHVFLQITVVALAVSSPVSLQHWSTKKSCSSTYFCYRFAAFRFPEL